MNQALITLQRVEKDYESGAGRVRALRDVSLEIRQGEFVAIVGTSGSGKSTLMNILGCLDRPTRGVYNLSGFDVGSRSSDARAVLRNRLIGFIFQGFNLLARTTALENVELPLLYRGVSARERRARAVEALEAVGLGTRMHHTPNQLSGGQQQRVAIARALVTRPPMLLADEPTGNLDTRTSLEVLALLQRLNRERGITIVLVTHEHDIAACAGRVITFRDGRVLTDEVQDRPHDAAEALALLGAPDASPLASGDSQTNGSSDRAASLPVSYPIPKRVYPAMVLAGAVGALVGALYARGLVSSTSLPVAYAWAYAFSMASEATIGTWLLRQSPFFRRLSVGPQRSDVLAAVALVFTVIETVLVGALVASGVLPGSHVVLDSLEDLQWPGVAAAMASALVGVAAIGLLRFQVLSMVASWASHPDRARTRLGAENGSA